MDGVKGALPGDDDAERITRAINGGIIGIEDRKKTTKAAKEILSDEV
ncbi:MULTISPECIES: hypothetical protein [Erwinia]|nr:hypothetical protein [Erwinia aphidicola]MCP2230792.1 putative chitinase [Erwinia aphidicola]